MTRFCSYTKKLTIKKKTFLTHLEQFSIDETTNLNIFWVTQTTCELNDFRNYCNKERNLFSYP
jgi:hypothetical protein